jgi:hypothetical protein
MTKNQYKIYYRNARLGNLETLAFCAKKYFQWFLHEVYDLRFPLIGDKKGLENNSRFAYHKTFDSLAGKFSHTLSKYYHTIYKIV